MFVRHNAFMVGVLITFLFAIGAMGAGQFLLKRLTKALDPAESIGVSGLIGLGAIGLITLFIGLIPGGLSWGIALVGGISILGFIPLLHLVKAGDFRFAKPEGANLIFAFAIGIALFFALVGVLAPSDTLDWDTLAYHLAVPKIWLHAGQIQYVPFIHHSNFPFTVENLFLWGLSWGGQSGAKAFTLAFFIFGLFSIFGLARRHYGIPSAWWAVLTFATVPVILWESGTGYIDVPHGLYGGLGILFAAQFLKDDRDRSSLWLSAIMLGFATGSKYTGLQTLAVVGFVLVIGLAVRRQAVEGLKSAFLVGLVATSIAAPWYVKSVVLTGNPVFPFFFERLGGKNWDQRRADVYRLEQQTFGAGSVATRHQITQIGTAVLGLAYQPGRYVNPQQEKGNGTPLGAVGVVVIAVGLLWMLSGVAGVFESTVLAAVGLSLFLWFFLSQQSRYFVPLAIPLAVLAGGAVDRLKVGRILAGLITAQAAYSLYLVYAQRFQIQSQAAFGKVSADDYQTQTVGFYEASQDINKQLVGGKLALYDEVFGYLLDVPYVWANPPHSLLIPYDSMTDGASYVSEMKKLGFTHVYISTSAVVKDPGFVKQWVGAMGLQGDPVPFPEDQRKAMLANWQDKWMVLLSDAVAQHLIQPTKGYKHGILFKIL